MAKRPVYIPSDKPDLFVETRYVNFEWIYGFAFSQRQKCVDSFHKAIQQELHFNKILEVSSKSRESLGIKLSAFNLIIVHPSTKKSFSVECAYQSGKIFEGGGPFPEIRNLSSKEAKQFFRDKTGLGKIIGFKSNGHIWPTYPTTLFYDWIYLNALVRCPELIETISNYNAFTDIDFNPEKSKNCQAYSVALFSELQKRNLLKEALSSRQAFQDIILSQNISNAHENCLI